MKTWEKMKKNDENLRKIKKWKFKKKENLRKRKIWEK